MNKPLYKQLVDACKKDDYHLARALMDGYKPYQIRAAYRALEELEGYTAYCAAKRGEKSFYSELLGI